VGDSDSGEIELLDGPHYLLSLLTNSPSRIPAALPSADCWPMNVVPADFVAHAMHAISVHPDSVGRCYHLVDANPLSTQQALRLISERVRPQTSIDEASRWWMRRALEIGAVERMARRSRAFLHELDSHTFFNAMHATALLAPLGVHCPPLPDYVDALVGWSRRSMQGWNHSPGDLPGEADPDPVVR
jgi:hypothetical protein